MSISIWWFIGPVLYLAAGWLFAYAIAAMAVRGRKTCNSCGTTPSHDRRCDCGICTQRLYVCEDHDAEVKAWDVLAWPVALIIILCWRSADITKQLWRKYNPGVVVEKQAEKKHMAVLIRSRQEEEDDE